MNILIIEDEIKTARALARTITLVKPGAKIVGSIQSVESAVQYLSENPAPDLIFMDVQLADGLCFDIFRRVKVVSPVIFCTAYNDYAIEAFKSNGIDYILKPISAETIGPAFEKVESIRNFFQTHKEESQQLELLMNRIGENDGKKSFLVFKHNKYVIVPTESIAYFYIKNEIPTIVNFHQEEFGISSPLDEVHQLLSTKQFFRLNRQYLISFKSVLEVEHYFARKLFVKLLIPTAEKLLVAKDKVTAFLSWLEDR
ncbi:two component transcriptional regulator, LytTR family [Pedobacter westerhofensis]|uniref:Two component transcriptional regulator, LytTR family n=1 Tax=Pedobacter westerhofensis TaxID=425512 RepID=A0A521CZ73_9SPHI|nr:LytTR family DNA-binding domain-containing protein [Pedobacter westerhofensis]SMO64718.1 two component transcriptional regulator, LytTR family [Pedobacter westerhofensis]